MLSKGFIKTLKQRYCVDDYTQIEGFWEAYNDDLPSRKHCLHHKYGIVLNKTREQLKYMGLYEHRYARELQIMLRSEHQVLHNKNRRQETRQKQSISMTGKLTGEKNPMYGRTGELAPMYGKSYVDYMTEEAVKEMRRKQSEAQKNKHHYNNGVIGVFTYECPEGFVSGKLKRNIK